MKFYHGTNNNFDKFRATSFDDCTHEYYGEAIYFSSDYDTAKYYGHRVIEIEFPDNMIDIRIDGRGRGINQVQELSTLIDHHNVIAIDNVSDYNLEGAQKKSFQLDDIETGEYKYNYCYHLSGEIRLSKAKANTMVDQLTALGVKSFASKDVFGSKYVVHTIDHLNFDQATLLNGMGIAVMKGMSKCPDTATTLIFAKQGGIDILNKIINN